MSSPQASSWITHIKRRRALLVQMAGFASVGAVGATVLFVLLILLVELGDVDAVSASITGYVLGAAISYLLNHRYTFRSDQRHREAVPKFIVIALIGTGLNAALMQVAVHNLDMHYIVAQAAAIIAVFFWNFLANRFWTFKLKK